MNSRIRFDWGKLTDPKKTDAFPALIDGKFAALNMLDIGNTRTKSRRYVCHQPTMHFQHRSMASLPS
ncbi:hypothetical protein DPMN_041347 [Dreissena polymorpha]|uniref:Uncharacterized protein n=1 Tax=Dreissena polymorpha TaxID=45954 RepID=A0A9D4CWN4_DREPO|nr:hypothetical protein DPMN_041347 [Dreissena polymorpha]